MAFPKLADPNGSTWDLSEGDQWSEWHAHDAMAAHAVQTHARALYSQDGRIALKIPTLLAQTAFHQVVATCRSIRSSASDCTGVLHGAQVGPPLSDRAKRSAGPSETP